MPVITIGSFTINQPIYGYNTTVDMAIDLQRTDTGNVESFDYGSSYDKRKCECTFVLSGNEFTSLDNYLKSNRGAAITMTLAYGSGFFPAGPDKGDAGSFSCVFDITDGLGQQIEPWKYYSISATLRFTGYPSYSLPTQISEGDFQIGSITGLRVPQKLFNVSIRNGWDTQLTESSAVNVLDRGPLADYYSTKFEQQAGQSKAAALINYIAGSARGTQFSIVSQTGTLPFGKYNGDGTFNIKLSEPSLKIVHNKFNNFSVDFSLCKI